MKTSLPSRRFLRKGIPYECAEPGKAAAARPPRNGVPPASKILICIPKSSNPNIMSQTTFKKNGDKLALVAAPPWTPSRRPSPSWHISVCDRALRPVAPLLYKTT